MFEKIDYIVIKLVETMNEASDRFTLYANSCSNRTGIPKINRDEMARYELVLPPILQQLEITEVLSYWDSAVEKTEQLISAKEKHYRWLANKLLFGQACPEKPHKKTRWFNLPDSWQLLHVGDIAEEQKRFNRTGDAIPVLSCTKHRGLVDSRQYFKKQVFSQDTSKYKIVAENEFAYATNHIEEGSIGYQNLYPQGLVSPMYTVFKTDDQVVDGFLFKLLKTETYRHIFEVHTSSSVDRRGSLRWKEFAKLPVPIPPIEEQHRINELLSLARTEINLLKQQSELYRQQKRGLMQKLLTGEWRVNSVEQTNQEAQAC